MTSLPPAVPHAAGLPAGPRDTDELALLAADFPAFRLSRETVLGRTRYVARSTSLATHPHTVITDDPAELRAALTTTDHAAPVTRAVSFKPR